MFQIQIHERLMLKQLELSEDEALFALTEQNRGYLRQWLPFIDDTKSIEDTRNYLYFCKNEYERSQIINAGIWYEGQLVGCIGYSEINRFNRFAKIGYWLSEQMQGKGIMTQACGAIVRYGFQELNLNRLEIRVATKNQRSQAIPKRLGFVYEGVIRQTEWLYDYFVDHMVFGMLREEFDQLAGSFSNYSASLPQIDKQEKLC